MQLEPVPENAHRVNQAAKAALVSLGQPPDPTMHYGFQLAWWAVWSNEIPWRTSVRRELREALPRVARLSPARQQAMLCCNATDEYFDDELLDDPRELAQAVAETLLEMIKAQRDEFGSFEDGLREEEPPDYGGIPITNLRRRAADYLRALVGIRIRHPALWVIVGDQAGDVLGAAMFRIDELADADDAVALGRRMLAAVQAIRRWEFGYPNPSTLVFAEQMPPSGASMGRIMAPLCAQAIGSLYAMDPDFRMEHLGCYLIDGFDVVRVDDFALGLPSRSENTTA